MIANIKKNSFSGVVFNIYRLHGEGLEDCWKTRNTFYGTWFCPMRYIPYA